MHSAAAADRLSLLVSRAAASLDAGRGDVSDLSRPPARAADEPLVAGPLLAARLREERLRRARVRRRRPRAARPTRPDPYGWNVDRPRRQRDREVQGVRRSRRRHVPRRRRRRTRTSTCRRRSCGRAGSTIGRSTVTFVQPAGHAVAGRHAAAPGSVAARVHRAQPAVPDGQPVGVRADRDPPVHGRAAHVPLRAAPHRHRRRARRAS